MHDAAALLIALVFIVIGFKDITNYLSGFYKNVSVLFNNNNSAEYVAAQTLNAINKIVNGNNADNI